METWLENTEANLEFQHALLAVQALEQLKVEPDIRISLRLMRTGYLAGRKDVAQRLAGEILIREDVSNGAMLVECHNILARIALDEGQPQLAAERFSAGEGDARAAGLDREEWDQETNKISALRSERAITFCRLARDCHRETVARRMDDPRMLAKTLTDRGTPIWLGKSRSAYAAHEEASQEAQRPACQSIKAMRWGISVICL